MADEEVLTADAYRLRAKELMAQTQNAKDENSKRTLLELASSWLELARRAEESR